MKCQLFNYSNASEDECLQKMPVFKIAQYLFHSTDTLSRHEISLRKLKRILKILNKSKKICV